MYRNHVAPRTKLYVPKDDFPISLTYILCLEINGNAHRCCFSDEDESLSEPCIGGTRFALLNKNPPEIYGGSSRTDEETGHDKTRQCQARRMDVSNSRQREATKQRAEEKPNLDAAREQRGILFRSGRGF